MSIRRRVFLGLLMAAPVLVLLPSCGSSPDPWAGATGPKLLAFFPPLFSLASCVAGPDATVRPFLTTRGPHDYEVSTSDARQLAGANALLINGLGLDDGPARRLANIARPKPAVVALTAGIPKDQLRTGVCQHCLKNHGAGDADHDHDHQDIDPHVWLGVPEAQRMLEAVRVELTRLAPDKEAAFRERATATSARLDQLLADGKARLAAKGEKPKVLTNHDSMQYFARAFGVEIVGSIEAPGQEPSGQRLSELVKLCKEQNVRIIAVEPQYPATSGAATLQRELKRHGIDAAFVEIDPLETCAPGDLDAGWYERKLKMNVERLAAVLK